MAERGEARLLVEGHRIVDLRLDAVVSEPRLELVATGWHGDDVLIEDVALAAIRQVRRPETVDGQMLVVVRRMRLPSRVPLVEMRKLHQQRRGLNRVEPEVPADHRVVVLRPRPVVAQPSQRVGEPLVTGQDHPAVPDASEVLAGEEGEAPRDSGRAGLDVALPGSIPRPDCLRGILDDRHAIPRGGLQNRRHVGALPIQMHRHDCLHAVLRALGAPEPCLQKRRAHRVRARVDVHERRRGPETRDDAGRREKRIRRRDYHVADPDLECHQDREQRVGPGRDADGVASAGVGGDRVLERLHLGSTDVAGRPNHLGDGVDEIRFDGLQLRVQVEKRHFRHDGREPSSGGARLEPVRHGDEGNPVDRALGSCLVKPQLLVDRHPEPGGVDRDAVETGLGWTRD